MSVQSTDWLIVIQYPAHSDGRFMQGETQIVKS